MRKIIILLLATVVSCGMMAQHHHGPHEHGPAGHGPGHRHVIECATGEQLAMAVQVLEAQSFDDKKLEIAKLAVVLGRFCTDDLARISKVFSFDDNRLEFFLFAYDYCEDPQNYPFLREAFSFESNYDKMMKKLYPGRY